MFRNYLTIALRNLSKNRVFSLINIGGLAVSMSVCLLIILILADQNSYDRFHTNKDRIYRIHTIGTDNSHFTTATSALPLGQELKQSYTGIEQTTTLVRKIGGNAIYDDKVASGGGYFADGNLFQTFDFQLARGNPQTALRNPYSLVISQEIATTLFGNSDPLGKIVQFNHTGINPGGFETGNRETSYGAFTITGVLQSPAGKTHLPFKLLASLSTLPALVKDSAVNLQLTDWNNVWDSYTYVLLQEGKRKEELQATLHQIAAKHYTDKNANTCDFIAEPLLDLTPADLTGNQTYMSIPKVVLWIISILGMIVMLSACLNYTNLSVARALSRAKEVGVRKVSGASRGQIFAQFAMEAVVVSLFALVVSIGLLVLLKMGFSNLWVYKYLDVALSTNGMILLCFVAFSVGIGLIAGILPSIYLSAFSPLQTLKNMSGLRLYKRHTLRKVLLVVQFCVSLIFIISTTLLYTQLKFLMVKDYGFDKNNMVNINLYKTENYQRFVHAISSNKDVISTSACSFVPATFITMGTQIKKADSPKDSLQIYWMDVDAGFVPTWGLKLIAGNNLRQLPGTSGEQEVLITEKTVVDFKYPSARAAVGQKILLDGKAVAIAGVVSDFQYQGIMQKIAPVVLRNRPAEFGVVNVRISGKNPMATVAYLEQQWKKVNPSTKFEYEFLDQQLLGFHLAMNDIAKILGFLSFLAVLISCLGLLGMATYTAETRTKEIGVRKVLGASVPQIALLLSKSFVTLLGIAIVIATPLAYFLNNLWLEFFAYRVNLGPGILLSGVLIMVVLSMVTVFSQTWRAARANPVDSLRNE